MVYAECFSIISVYDRVADDPSGATVCTTMHGIKAELVIHFG